ncbi:heavy metal translocating P-type ATPase [uncultured Anaerovibrio sp.]|uniref:heavy metal translocating P-type ATPase n=1 Tax=uncultured Anaerovibrio sp. TaxID=361586 RepID=UPI0025E1F51E|nr:heavy metal translocating P-type ATPase [uncultured Anaerovibrio sp.]
MTTKQKKNLSRIIAAIVLLVAGIFLGEATTYGIVLSLLAFGLAGWDVIYKAIRNISKGQVFDEFFLMTVASFGAIFIQEYAEGAAVMSFYQLGEWFQGYATGRVRQSISDLIDIRPDFANVLRDGEVQQVDPYEVETGEIIVVRPGERIPLDGIVVEGRSLVDTAALTGEPVPQELLTGKSAISGCINQSATLQIRTTTTYDQSTVERVLELVETSGAQKAKVENFITRFARVYTPLVVGLALLVALIPPLLFGGEVMDWLYRALTFLVISCPCALVISIPMSFFGGIGGASKAGILVKGGNYLERLAEVGVIAFDKTGTLTEGNFEVQEIVPSDSYTKAEIIYYAAAAELDSLHPIADSLQRALGREVDRSEVDNVQEIAGQGVIANVKNHHVLVGRALLLANNGIGFESANESGTTVYVAVDGQYAGRIAIADRIKADAGSAIKALRQLGIRKLVMLSGDKKETACRVAEKIGLDAVLAELLPEDKVKGLNELFQSVPHGKSLVYVGDGINDAPVLARADVGVAMGGIGSDAAIEAADVVLMTDEPGKLVTAIQIAKKTTGICWQNIVMAIGVKVLVMILGAAGVASLWAAVFADVGVAFLAILNSMRSLYGNFS